nr:hypothetical protein [Bacillus altitudinis]
MARNDDMGFEVLVCGVDIDFDGGDWRLILKEEARDEYGGGMGIEDVKKSGVVLYGGYVDIV